MSDCADLLFELGTEELPPVALKSLKSAFQKDVVGRLEQTGLQFSSCKSFASPRRLAIMVSDCSLQQPDNNIDRRGPAVQAAFDKEGNPTKAAEGFAKSCGVEVADLGRQKTEKGEWLSYQLTEKGKTAAELLPGIFEAALDNLPIPKRMRWGNSNAMFVRPVHWVLFLLGDQVVDCSILDTQSDNFTYGHRFHHPEAISINSAAEYEDKLSSTGYVIADFEQRKNLIEKQLLEAAKKINGHIPVDTALLDEVTALVEWPVAIIGDFDKEYLEVPHEALILTMKKNQKYFPVFDNDQKLLNHFITIANIESSNPETIQKGNERVIRPRLADAKFFWEQDAKQTLEQRLDHLKGIVFQKQLGSIYDKSLRVSKLASHISNLIGGNPDLAERAGLISRCDLVTEMVYEFADMQGIMGRYQAERDGENSEVAQAMDEIYMPRFSGDQLPRTQTGISLALADRLDTLTGIFGIGLKPSGTKDPFALRRASLGLLRILREYSLSLNLHEIIGESISLHGSNITENTTSSEVNTYILERLKGIFSEDGISTKLVNAVASINPSNVVDFENRIAAVEAFSQLPEAENLAAANKRIQNILKKTDEQVPVKTDDGLFELDQERSLFEMISRKENDIEPLLADKNYQQILISLVELKQPIDDFFDHVMVMAEDKAIRQNRLSLLQRVHHLFYKVADISVLQDS